MTRTELRSLMESYALNQDELSKLCCVAHTSVFKWLSSDATCAAIRPAPLGILNMLAAVSENERSKLRASLKKHCQPTSFPMLGLYVLLRHRFQHELVKDAVQ